MPVYSDGLYTFSNNGDNDRCRKHLIGGNHVNEKGAPQRAAKRYFTSASVKWGGTRDPGATLRLWW